MKRIAYIENVFSIQTEGYLEDAIAFIRTSLESMGISKKQVDKTELISEEIIVLFVQHAPEDGVLQIQVKRFLSDANVVLRMKGEEFDPYGEEEISLKSDLDAVESDDHIRSILLRSYGEKFKYSNKRHMNRAKIVTGQTEQSMIYNTILAMVLGLFLGFFAKMVFPGAIMEGMCTYLLDPVKTMFMNALKIVIAPVVFFSIVTCFSQFRSIAELGRMGIKVFGMYLLTTAIAVFIGIGMFYLIEPGEFGFALSSGVQIQGVDVDVNVDTSLLHTIINIVPSNIVRPFLESDTLQIIFLAVLCGMALSMIGEYAVVLKDFFEACNSLFLTITTMIAKLIPVAVFCSVTLLVVQLGGDSLLSVLGGGMTQLLAVFVMMGVYGILILVIGRLNPLVFFKKAKEGMLMSFTLSSSSAAMPTNIKICTEKLGIAPKLCSFSIPLGATINMDGACIFLSVLGLFLARMYGVEVASTQLASLIITIVLLSLGAPGVPGAGLVCLGIVLKTLNVPVEAMGMVMAICPILDMFATMSNTTGDMAAALIVARSENLIDLETYNKKVK